MPDTSNARPASAPPLLPDRVERALYLAAALLGAATFWIAPRPPMSDLPQHAAQIALWRDLLTGVSPFADLVAINLVTPYLIGYGLALPLSFAMSAGAAAKTVLTLSFFAFLWMAKGLRRDLGGDRRVDWLFFVGYFGLAWVWGFYTFLVAAPLVLLFARAALHHARAPDARAAAGVLAVAFALLLSHGLQFLFAGLIGAMLTLERALAAWRTGGARAAFAAGLRRVWPYLAMLAMFAAFMALRRLAVGPDPIGEWKFVAPVWRRLPTAVALLWDDSPRPLFMALSLAAMAAPLGMGLRPAPGPGLALLAAVLAVELFVFDTAFGTGFVYKRFALYLAVFWALSLRPSARAAPEPRAAARAHAALIACVLAALATHAHRVWAFAREDADFPRILDAVKPGERILALSFDPDSAAFGNQFTYLDWGGWLQSEKGPFVEFSFATYPPQPVRFRPGKASRITETQNWSPQLFDWSGWDAGIYDAYLVRGDENVRREGFLSRAPCRFVTAASAPRWTLYRKAECRAPD